MSQLALLAPPIRRRRTDRSHWASVGRLRERGQGRSPGIAYVRATGPAHATCIRRARRREGNHYPGQEPHTVQAIAKAQQNRFGAVLRFELSDGGAAARRLVEAVEGIMLAESLGGIESLLGSRRDHDSCGQG